MDKLKVKAEKTKRALLEASCREIDATTRAKLEEVNEVINFDQMFLLHENQKSVELSWVGAGLMSRSQRNASN